MINARVIPTVLALFLCPALAGDISIVDDLAAFASRFYSVEAFPQDSSISSGTGSWARTTTGLKVTAVASAARNQNLIVFDFFTAEVNTE